MRIRAGGDQRWPSLPRPPTGSTSVLSWLFRHVAPRPFRYIDTRLCYRERTSTVRKTTTGVFPID